MIFSFFLGKNDKVNTPLSIGAQPLVGAQAPGPAMKYSKTNSLQGLAHAPNISHKQEPQTITPQSGSPSGPHKEEKIALVLALESGFAIWNMFR